MKKYRVEIPSGLKPYPEQHEITAVDILTQHFHKDVVFIKSSNHKTADFVIQGVEWELKSPTGQGKNNIQHILQRATTQSANIILDSRRSKIHQNRIVAEARYQAKLIKKIERLLLITKSKKVIVIK